MTATAIGILLFTVSLLLAQGVVVLRYVAVLRAAGRPAVDGRLPKAAVVMAARGADPFLPEALEGLLAQDYPDFEIHIVIDSDQDVAWQAVEAARRGDDRGRIHVDVLRTPATTCSLKNSALVQAIGGLDESAEIVAFLDGDVVPHSGWLRDLAAPLLDPKVGVVTGNRWFVVPEEAQWGTLVRYLWNVGAVVQMWLNRMVWAGSMALRRGTLCESGLLDVWRRSMSTDSVVYSHIRKHGLRVEFAADAIMLNSEEIALPECVRWLRRQMFMARLYHPRWIMALLQAISIAWLQVGGSLLSGAALLAGDWPAAACALAAVVAYWTVSLLFVRLVEGAVRRRKGCEPPAADARRLRRWTRLALAMLATNAVFPAALATVLTARRVVWRGIGYKIHGPFQIERGPHAPFRSLDVSPGRASIV